MYIYVYTNKLRICHYFAGTSAFRTYSNYRE